MKDFENWHQLKAQIDLREKRTYFREREIWWCNLGVNIGYEQDGKGAEYLRPVLVFKKHNSKIFTAIPLSTKIKPENKFYHKITFHGKEQSAIIIQARAIDSKRLLNKMGELSNAQFAIIAGRFKEIYC